jgi:hypothetical protein
MKSSNGQKDFGVDKHRKLHNDMLQGGGGGGGDVTAHEAAADPHTGYQKESEKDVANGYAGLDAGGLVPDARIAATIARDSEVTSAVSTHAGLPDPHPGYATDTDLSNHAGAADPHTGYQKESEKDQNNGYAGLDGSGLVPDARIAATIARDSEVTSAIATHAGLADPHSVYALDTDLTAHAGAADPHTGYQRESEKDQNNGYAGLDGSGLVPDARIAATIARDSEVTTAVSNHAGAADPHTGYQKESEKDQNNGYAGLDASGLVPDARIAATIARDSEVTTAVNNHAGAADPHTGYQKESEKSTASGYASLDAGTKVPTAELGGAGADNTKFLRGDQSWATPTSGPVTLGYAEAVTPQSGITTVVDITSLSVPVTVAASRRLRITGHYLVKSTVAGDKAETTITQDGTILAYDETYLHAANGDQLVIVQAIVIPSAGTRTYKLRVARALGTGTVTVDADPTYPAWLLVEDITGTPSSTLQPSVSRSTTVSIANTETQILSMPLPANTLRVGAVYRIKVAGLWTNTTTTVTSVIRVRVGSTTLTGNIAAGISMAGGNQARTNIPFVFDAMVTVLSIGAGGTIFGVVSPTLGNVVAPVLSAPVTAAVAVDTTAAKLIEMTYISGGASTSINVISASIVQEV